MGPKKKSDEQRSELEIAIDAHAALVREAEAQVASIREALSDLQVHSARVKQLEAELAPREAELKGVIGTFNRLLDSGIAIARRDKGNSDDNNGGGGGSPVLGRADGSSAGTGSDGEVADRELLRQLQAAAREALTSVLVPLFHLPQTAGEVAAEEARELAQQQQQQQGGAPGASPAAAAAAAAKGGKPHAKAEAARRTVVDYDLECPPGVDRAFFQDVMKLRATRLTLERAIAASQKEIAASRVILARRRDEGATKSAAKKAEKQLAALQKAQRELLKKKEEEDFLRRRSESVVVGGSGGAPKDKKKK